MRGPRVAAVIARASATLSRRGAPLILGARYIPVGRVAVNMSAGALGYPWRKFLPLTIVAAITWAAYSVGLGMLAGRWFEGQPLLSVIVGAAVAIILGLVIDRVGEFRRRRAERAAGAVRAPVAVVDTRAFGRT